MSGGVIYKLDDTGKAVIGWGNTMLSGVTRGDDDAAGGHLDGPIGLKIDELNNIYVAEITRIQKFHLR
jgi:hypothetical protein